MWDIFFETIFFLAVAAALGILIGYIISMMLHQRVTEENNRKLNQKKEKISLLEKELRFLQKDLQRTEVELLDRENKVKILQADITVQAHRIKHLETENTNSTTHLPKPADPKSGAVDEEKFNRLTERYHNVLREREQLIDQLEECKRGEAEKVLVITQQQNYFEKLRDKAAEINFDIIGRANDDEKDDLQLIKGIGPFIEKKLNALGIFTFAQIAKFDAEIAENVNDAIEFFPGRIARDDWQGQAKTLMKKYYKI